MQVILEPYSVPERGTFQIQQTVTIHISAQEARRQVERWLLHEVNSQMGSGVPVLVVGTHNVWRVPIFWSAPPVGRVGYVGNVDVDVLSGEIIGPAECKAELIQYAQDLASGLPAFQLREPSPAYLVTSLMPTHQPGRPNNNPYDLITKSS
jgi:hypothetical protein